MATRNPSLSSARAQGSKVIPSDMLNAIPTFDKANAELIGERGAWWYTGPEPQNCPGFDRRENVIRSLPLPNTRTFTRQSVLDYFDNTWCTTEVLFGALQGAEAFTRQPYHQLRHPKIFYYGHPAVLYVNKFRVAGLLDEGVDAFIEQMFETGVDEMSWDDLSHGRDDWPSVRRLHEYRAAAYAVIRKAIETHPCMDTDDIGPEQQGWAVFMGFEHERIHIETSSVLIRELPLELVRKPDFWPSYHPSHLEPSAPVPTRGVDFPSCNEFVQIKGEEVNLGKELAYPAFGFDNEYGAKKVQVDTFRVSQYKVTNGEFLGFVKAGGYGNPKYWSKEGWGWKTFRNVKAPTFWVLNGPAGLFRYKLRAMCDVIGMRWDWPVDANYHEGKAYCAWRTEQDGSSVRYRITTEAEHMLLRSSADRPDGHRFAAARGTPLPPSARAHLKGKLAGSRSSKDSTCTPAQPGSSSAAAASEYSTPFTRVDSSCSINPLLPAKLMSPSYDSGGVNGGGPTTSSSLQGGSSDNGGFMPYMAGRKQRCPAADEAINPDACMVAWGGDAASEHGFNFQLAYGSSSPVTALPPSERGIYDAMGNVWEWGEDHFAAFHGYAVHPYYEDFSTPCFGGKHMMIMGGSWASTGQLCSKFARYQFRPHFFQHAGFRVVAPVVDVASYDMQQYGPANPVLPFFETSCMDGAAPHNGDGPCCSRKRRAEFTPTTCEQKASQRAKTEAAQACVKSDDLLAQFLSSHYGPHESVFPAAFGKNGGVLADGMEFPKRVAQLLVDAAVAAGVEMGVARVLDLGCAVGGSSFQMAQSVGEVVGVDISKTFIEVATRMRDNSKLDYECCTEGTSTERLTAALPEGSSTTNVQFLQSDACCLPTNIGTFDAVLAANIISCVTSPRACLQQIKEVLKPGGILVLTSSLCWDEKLTDRSNWLGGVHRDGTTHESEVVLKTLLAADYAILKEDSTPVVLRENRRKYQLLTAYTLVLQRNV